MTSWRSGGRERRRERAWVAFADDRRRLRIGLVNAMPDAAMVAAERQFAALMQAAAGPRGIELRLFALDGVERGEAGRARTAALYRPAREIASAGLDALVVTGAEPQAASLSDEPFWPAFQTLLATARTLRLPVLFSCLAAHAAVLSLDGVQRRPLAKKQSGVFRFVPAGADRLLEGVGSSWTTPHSRWNGLAGEDLRAAGYTLLGVSSNAGVDAFTRRVAGAPWLFLQGHPEYEAHTLLAETHRDLKRYLDGVRDAPPEPPAHLLDGESAKALRNLLDDAARTRDPTLMARWPQVPRSNITPPWRAAAARLCANFLASAQPYPRWERRGAERLAAA